MKVLLLHEMSGVHTELKKGLLKIGVEANIATFGDGWKKFSTDISLGSLEGFMGGAWSKASRQIALINKMRKFDIIQTISPLPFFRPINHFLQRLVFGHVEKVIYVAAGSDAIYRKHVRELPYYPPHEWFEDESEYKNLEKMLRYCSTIIPVCYEYAYCMKSEHKNATEVIPFPVDIAQHKVRKLGTARKLRIFHPLNRDDLRYDFKGTNLIKATFNRLADKYSDVAEFIAAGGLPHYEYDKLTDGVDIIVDQLHSMSYGMSAAYGMAKGKVVLSGLEEMTKVVEHYRHCPVINVRPDAEDLFLQIEALILDRERVRTLGEMSREFAASFHDHVKVASRFAEAYAH